MRPAGCGLRPLGTRTGVCGCGTGSPNHNAHRAVRRTGGDRQARRRSLRHHLSLALSLSQLASAVAQTRTTADGLHWAARMPQAGWQAPLSPHSARAARTACVDRRHRACQPAAFRRTPCRSVRVPGTESSQQSMWARCETQRGQGKERDPVHPVRCCLLVATDRRRVARSACCGSALREPCARCPLSCSGTLTQPCMQWLKFSWEYNVHRAAPSTEYPSRSHQGISISAALSWQIACSEGLVP